MFELLLVLAVVFGMVYMGAFDALIPSLNKLVKKIGWQDEPHTNDNLCGGMTAFVDATATVKTEFTCAKTGAPFEGRVNIRGTDWRAEQIKGDIPLTIGSKVTVRRTEGTKLYVEPAEV